MRKGLILIFMSLMVMQVFPQYMNGHLMIAGGGTENYGKWSDTPYGWAVEKSANKRVAIITYQTEPSNWLPDYFLHLGAIEAKNFIINSMNLANEQHTYDSLMTYDVIFFKGGNQAVYYQTYNNTLTEQAVIDKFNEGGVICGTSAGLAILGEIDFTAESGSIDSYDAIKDPFDNDITLKDDFLPFTNKYLFDSHFVERGRYGRLIGMLANRELSGNDPIYGFGIDDKTAACIDTNGLAYIFGTGATSFYMAANGNEYSIGEFGLTASAITVKAALHNDTFNLVTHDVIGLDGAGGALSFDENLSSTFYCTGANMLSKNLECVESFISENSANDTVIVVSKPNSLLADSYIEYFNSNGIPTYMMEATHDNADNIEYRHRIMRSDKFIVLDNSYDTFFGDFIHMGLAGQLLLDAFKQNGNVSLFVGSNAGFVASQVLINYDQQYASYDGLLQYGSGLYMLKTSIICPEAFVEYTDENVAAGIPYGMNSHGFRWGYALHHGSWLKCYTENENAYVEANGDFPLIVFENKGENGGFSDQSAVSSGEARDVSGFEHFEMQLMKPGTRMLIGGIDHVPNLNENDVQLYPNPATDYITIESAQSFESVHIYTIRGKLLKTVNNSKGHQIDISNLPPGIYHIRLKHGDQIISHRLTIL